MVKCSTLALFFLLFRFAFFLFKVMTTNLDLSQQRVSNQRPSLIARNIPACLPPLTLTLSPPPLRPPPTLPYAEGGDN